MKTAITDSLHDYLNRLRKKQYDLTARNRLINFKHSISNSIRFAGPDITWIVDRLLGSQKSVLLEPVPEPKKEDWVEKNGRQQRPEVVAHAKTIPINTVYTSVTPNHGVLQTLYFPDTLSTVCRKFVSKIKSASEEKGLRIAFLSVGFLEYPERIGADKTLQSPLLNIPIDLTKKGIDKRYRTQSFEISSDVSDYLSVNESLRIKLREDLAFELPPFAFDEESEPSGKDFIDYFEKLEELISGKLKWRLKREVAITLLSFQKQILIEDSSPEGWDVPLEDNPHLNQIIFGESESAGIDSYEGDYHIDNHRHENIPLIYDADTSQHSAIIDALDGKSIVIEGPPGTGKSQTITNLIASLINSGKRVLFVSEKLAALKVVKKRLDNANLSDFCLELHSNKSKTLDLLGDLKNRLDWKPNAIPNSRQNATKITSRKRTLINYKNALSAPAQEDLELTLHQLMWRELRLREKLKPYLNNVNSLHLDNAEQLSLEVFQQNKDNLKNIAKAQSDLGQVSRHAAFWGFYPRNQTQLDIQNLRELLIDGQQCYQALSESLDEFRAMVLNNDNWSDKDGLLSDKTLASVAHSFLSIAAANSPHNPALMATLMSHPVTEVSNYCNLIRNSIKELRASRTTLGIQLADFEKIDLELEERQRAEERRVFNETGIYEKPLSEAERLNINLTTDLKALEKRLTYVNQIFGVHGLPQIEKGDDLIYLKALINLIEILGDFNTTQKIPVIDKSSDSAIQEFIFLLNEAKSLEVSLKGNFYLDHLPDDESLGQALDTFRSTRPFMSIFSSRFKKADRLFKSICRSISKLEDNEKSKQLSSILKFKALIKKLEVSEGNVRALKIQTNGIETDVEPLEDLMDAYSIIEQYDAIALALRNVLKRESAVPLMRCRSHLGELKELLSLYSGVSDSVTDLRWDSDEPIEPKITSATDSCSVIAKTFQRVRSYVTNVSLNLRDYHALLDTLQQYEKDRVEFQHNKDFKQFFDLFFLGENTEVDLIERHIKLTDMLVNGGEHSNLLHLLFIEPQNVYLDLCEKIETAQERVTVVLQKFNQHGKLKADEWILDSDLFAQEQVEKIKLAIKDVSLVNTWAQYQTRKHELIDSGLEPYINDAEAGNIPFALLSDFYSWKLYSSLLSNKIHNVPEVANFSGKEHEEIRRDFQDIDKVMISNNGHLVAAECARNAHIPAGEAGPKIALRTENALIKHLIRQTRPRIKIRRIMRQANEAVLAMKPCLMMSPMAVAQYLPKNAGCFDYVIMDEASQIRLEDSIGVVARGKTLIVVGDSKQLPPTNFFRTTEDQEDIEIEDTTNVVSILDACATAFPRRSLNWHYRSQHQSLIAFSNVNFYENRLIVFPSPEKASHLLGVHCTYVKNAVYENRRNLKEAETVIKILSNTIKTHPDISIGIVTLNNNQREIIEEILFKVSQNESHIRDYIEKFSNTSEDLFVKNLENVQGDERDVIIISTTFGKLADGPVRQNFGPISRQDGWKRLNVLFTRARKSIQLVTSLAASDIVDDVSTPLGTKKFRMYLDYARTGVTEIPKLMNGDYDSDFEEFVAERLQAAGYSVVPQLGVSGYRIDLAIENPKAPGCFIAAIECDGATYHSGLSVRDRDRIRQEVLESLGWRGKIWRIWSSDWWRDPDLEFRNLLSFLEDRLDAEEVTSVSGDLEGDEEDLDDSEYSVPRSDLEELPLFADEALEVEIGDALHYTVDGKKEEQHIKIVRGPTSIDDGLVNYSMPLAQVLLGALVEDEVILRIPTKEPQTLKVTKIIKPLQAA